MHITKEVSNPKPNVQEKENDMEWMYAGFTEKRIFVTPSPMNGGEEPNENQSSNNIATCQYRSFW